MRKLSEKVLRGLGRVRPTKPKNKNIVDGVSKSAANKVRKKRGGGTIQGLERSPAQDEVVISNNVNQTLSTNSSSKNIDTKNRLGDFLIAKNQKLAKLYKKDLESIAKEIPEVEFVSELNESSTKELKSTLDKLINRADQYSERGFRGVVRDGVRATVFMPAADKNYLKIVEAMEKKGYKVAKTYAEGPDGCIILDKNGLPKMVPDIDVRFGANAVPSGYEDVQMRFEKNGALYELLILPGANYMAFKNKEHKLVFENFRQYKALGLMGDDGAKLIVKAIQKEFHGLTRKLYADAFRKDIEGRKAVSSVITLSEDSIEKLNNLFKSLKNLYHGKFNSLPPSKRYKFDFKQTKNYKNLDMLEQNLRQVMEMYKPIEK